MSKKIVIVGHGLAGSVLAHTLLGLNQDVVVLEADLPHAATQVSAGLINPFIGPKLNIPEDFLPCMRANERFFDKIELKSSINFLEKIQLIRVFQSQEQKNKWNKSSELFKINTITQSQCLEMGIDSKNGAGITRAWKLNSQEFISYSRQLLSDQKRYNTELFDATKWQHCEVVFCEGFRAKLNPWFKDLPFSPAQGDVLRIQSNYRFNASNGTWHLPENQSSQAIIGSTWKHEDVESGPTLCARNEILEKLTFLPDLKYEEILDHQSGVRSGTQDRQPILGTHPVIKNYHIFNGFGSRGCTTIALSAREMADLIIRNTPLPIHKDMVRFLGKS